jgi:branched-chain amino acid aminotransferase
VQSNKNNLFAFLHGQLVPLPQASLHVSDLSIQRGYGIFDFFRVQQNQVLFLDDYLNRFFQSADLMHLPVPHSAEELKANIYKLIQQNNLPASGIKMILTGGYSEDGYVPAAPNLLMVEQPLVLPGPEKVATGIKIITHDYAREIPLAKTINYSMGIRLINQIREQQAADVLYCRNGLVTELPRSNFFIVQQDDALITSGEVLAGITRKNVLALAGSKYRVEIRDVTLEEVLGAKEAFITSTTKRIMPVVQINQTVIGTGKPGLVTLALLKELLALEELELKTKA